MKPLRDWNDLPDFMRTEEVRPYYIILKKHEKELYLKRAFDVVAASILLILLAPIMLVVALWIKLDSPGPVFFRQTRITQYGKEFRIFKFRTMINDADRLCGQITIDNDPRITKVGSIIRKYRIDEFPQLLNVISGEMSFVGTRPESKKYVEHYKPVYNATLLLRAGITSEASIHFRNESELLGSKEDSESTYIEEILPEKMKYNLSAIDNYSIMLEFITILRTIIAVI